MCSPFQPPRFTPEKDKLTNLINKGHSFKEIDGGHYSQGREERWQRMEQLCPWVAPKPLGPMSQALTGGRLLRLQKREASGIAGGTTNECGRLETVRGASEN